MAERLEGVITSLNVHQVKGKDWTQVDLAISDQESKKSELPFKLDQLFIGQKVHISKRDSGYLDGKSTYTIKIITGPRKGYFIKKEHSIFD